MERQILLLGDPKLYEISKKVTREELEELRPVFTDMFDCIKGILATMRAIDNKSFIVKE